VHSAFVSVQQRSAALSSMAMSEDESRATACSRLRYSHPGRSPRRTSPYWLSAARRAGRVDRA